MESPRPRKGYLLWIVIGLIGMTALALLMSRRIIADSGSKVCQENFPNVPPAQCECFGKQVADEIWITYWVRKASGSVPIDSDMARAILNSCRRGGGE